MRYKLKFKSSAEKEWRKLGATVQAQFKNKLIERLENPRVRASKLRGQKDRYKIKLQQSGYRLVYEVREETSVVAVIAVAKRRRGDVYAKAAGR